MDRRSSGLKVRESPCASAVILRRRSPSAAAVDRPLAPKAVAVAVAGAGAEEGESPRPRDPLLEEPSAETLHALDAHFDRVFAALGPRHAAARYLRRRLSAELLLHVEQRSRVEECTKQIACSRAVLAALRMHERFLDNALRNKKHCVSSKYHNLLYAVAKLCFDCRLQDSEVVCNLLKAIFSCESSLDNLMVGALLGIVSTHVFNAWKSDFDSRKENLEALDYFLEQAGRGHLRFDLDAVWAEDEDDDAERRPAALACSPGSGVGFGSRVASPPGAAAAGAGAEAPSRPTEPRDPVGLADLPLRAYGHLRPLALAVLLANADAVLLLLRHGARPVDASPLYAWYGRRVADDNLAECIRVLLRAVRWVEVLDLGPEAPGAPLLPDLQRVPEDVVVFAKDSPEAVLVPEERRRGAACAPSLKHLARCASRASLRAAGSLPFGLRALELPAALRDYLDLQED